MPICVERERKKSELTARSLHYRASRGGGGGGMGQETSMLSSRVRGSRVAYLISRGKITRAFDAGFHGPVKKPLENRIFLFPPSFPDYFQRFLTRRWSLAPGSIRDFIAVFTHRARHRRPRVIGGVREKRGKEPPIRRARTRDRNDKMIKAQWRSFLLSVPRRLRATR